LGDEDSGLTDDEEQDDFETSGEDLTSKQAGKPQARHVVSNNNSQRSFVVVNAAGSGGASKTDLRRSHLHHSTSIGPMHSHATLHLHSRGGHGASRRHGSTLFFDANRRGSKGNRHAFGKKETENAKKLRHKVAAAYKGYLDVAMCRLVAAAAHHFSPPTEVGTETKVHSLRHAWPHHLIPAIVWLPFSLSLTRHTKPSLISAKDKNKKNKNQVRSLTTLEFKSGVGLLKGRVKQETREQVQAVRERENHGDEMALESSSKLREAFRVAVSEAKLAQAQSLAASRDVQSLKMDLERSTRIMSEKHCKSTSSFSSASPGKGQRPAPRGGGGAKAAAVAMGEPQLRAQLLEQRETLRKLEASLKEELSDVTGQMKRLRAEIDRRHRRSATKFATTEDIGHSPRCSPLEQSQTLRSSPSGKAVGHPGIHPEMSRVSSKYLSSSRVLPDIYGARGTASQDQSIRKGGAFTARARLETSEFLPARNCVQERPLPNIPWRAGTAP
jgi:hypothetical protein